MADAGVMVEIRLEDLFSKLRTDPLRFFHTGIRIVCDGFSFPPAAELNQFPAVLFILEKVFIVFTLIKRRMQCFINDPVDGKFRIDRCCLGVCCDLADDEIFV